MNYIIYDLEFNQAMVNKKEGIDCRNPNLLFEIIQIGAVKVNSSFKVVSKFDALIKPTVYPDLHPYIENLTKINSEELNTAKPFKEVFEKFIEFIGTDNVVLCVWGKSDIKELLRNVEFHQLPTDLIPKNYIDIQNYATKELQNNNKSKIGLKNALELLNISFTDGFHNAFFDALCTFKVFKAIYNSSMSPTFYKPTSRRAPAKPKENIDFTALIKQFEKMYSKKMTKREIEIIKLSYIMGKTGQFIK